MAHYIKAAELIVVAAEQAKGFWDNTGLDMHIAVKNSESPSIVVSTKHWLRVHYIIPSKKITVKELWDEVLAKVSEDVGRTLIRSEKGPYVYIHKLNIEQTQSIFDKIKERIGGFRIERHLERSWDISDAVTPPE